MARPPSQHDVFLSFRGEDTRHNFTSDLYAELRRKKIKTFIDDILNKGDDISHELHKAIEESMIYIIIFSKDYASSRWCLDELAEIMECKKKYDQRHVIPVFYEVDPSIVRHQKESYADAFVNHEKRFDVGVTQRWKVTLTKAAGIAGWDSSTTRPQSKLVGSIVKDITRKLGRSYSTYNKRVVSVKKYDVSMVGIEEHIAEIQSLLYPESAAVRIIGIWGMGGIGKSTLALALHNNLATQFSSKSCVIHAQKEIERVGIDSVRRKYLSELLKEDISSNVLSFAIERVKRAKVLLILDDVKNSSQLQELIGGHGNFGPGSRIIVTSKDMQELRNVEADEIYQLKEMNYQDSLKLLSLKVFEQDYPKESYTNLVEYGLTYAKGVPLALQVLGPVLYGVTEKGWVRVFRKLEMLPDVGIINVLKLGYNVLMKQDKNIILDIVCFYMCMDSVDKVVELLDDSGYSAYHGIDILKYRGFISILENHIEMHDLIWEMGKEVVRQQCVDDPAKRSHLWDHEEIDHVVRNNKGTNVIECISLDMCRIKEVQLHPKVFKSMPNLRILYFHKYSSSGVGQSNVILPASLESLPDGLKVLHWDEFPLRSLTLDFIPRSLVRICMCGSHLEQLWEDDKELPNLKRLNLSRSWKLIRIPNLSRSPNIEEIILSGCESLTSLPNDLCKLKFLRKLDMSGCSSLEKFPEIETAMENLEVLVLDGTAIQELPSPLEFLEGLEELSSRGCQKLKTIPSSILKLNGIRKLDFTGCELLM